ncbi:BTAD domain-containing putative transcriptional regulator [Streptomyces sp. NPDC004042]|uniref:BTAD domain-containing putative transcriptional regulator n=1 Tax=Streptomyces sp. NPDC004042 TaxID=3154451 RepID=UPI0033B39761
MTAGRERDGLRAARIKAGLTQEEVARRAGISVRTVRHIERGEVHTPRHDSLDRLARVVGYDLAAHGPRPRGGPDERAAAPYEIRLFGPLTLFRAGLPVAAPPKLRALLGLLAVQPDQVVGHEEIADALWPGDAPPGYAGLVHTYAARLRRVFGQGTGGRGGGRRIGTVRGGYVFNSTGVRLDLHQFEERVARAARTAGFDPLSALELYGQALRGRQGRILQDVPQLWQHPAVVRVAQRHIDVASDLADLALRLNRPGYAVEHLVTATHEDPLHEGLQARMMLALAGSGRRAAALRLFADLRSRLRKELGVEPSDEVWRARHAVIAADTPEPLPQPGAAALAAPAAWPPPQHPRRAPKLLSAIGRQPTAGSRTAPPGLPPAAPGGPRNLPGAGSRGLRAAAAAGDRPPGAGAHGTPAETAREPLTAYPLDRLPEQAPGASGAPGAPGASGASGEETLGAPGEVSGGHAQDVWTGHAQDVRTGRVRDVSVPDAQESPASGAPDRPSSGTAPRPAPGGAAQRTAPGTPPARSAGGAARRSSPGGAPPSPLGMPVAPPFPGPGPQPPLGFPARLSSGTPAQPAAGPRPQPAPGPPSHGPLRVIAPPAQLPATTPWFVGRDQQLGALNALLTRRQSDTASVSIGVLHGPREVGKTALAVRWAHQRHEAFPDGQLYADLQGGSGRPVPAATVLTRFLRSLGVPDAWVPGTCEEAAALFRSMVAGRRFLVLLDDAADAAQVRSLLPGTPGNLVLITSRTPLADLVTREGAVPIPVDALSPAEAHALIEARLGAERTAAEPGAVAELVAVCGSLPVPLREAAVRLAAEPRLSLRALVDELVRTGPGSGRTRRPPLVPGRSGAARNADASSRVFGCQG